nr:PorT family protein [Bacteroides sp.]
MKKIFRTLVCLVLLAVSASASAQFRYGPTAGVTISDLHFKQDLFSVDQAVGGLAGITAEMMFPGIGFGIDFGLQYELRGAFTNLGERKLWQSEGYGREHVMLHYVSLPIHLRFKWTRMDGLEDYIAPFVYGGPEFGFLAGHSRIDAYDYAGGEVGLAVGLGAELFKNWQVSAAYCWGMTYALKTAQLTNLSAQNRTWTVRFAYLF